MTALRRRMLEDLQRRGLAPKTQMGPNTGSWPYLVKRGGLEVSPRFPVRRGGGKTAPSLGESFSISPVEMLMPSTSPKAAKSPAYSAKAQKDSAAGLLAPAGLLVPDDRAACAIPSGRAPA
jgi:hypothetical protein